MTPLRVFATARTGKVCLANGQPAYTRGGFVTQAMIERHGSYTAARQAMAYEARRKVEALRLRALTVVAQERGE